MATTYPIHRSFPKRNKQKNLPEILEVGTVFLCRVCTGVVGGALLNYDGGVF